MKKGKTLGAYLHGGAQEKKKRAGTENIPGIVGFGKATELTKKNLITQVIPFRNGSTPKY